MWIHKNCGGKPVELEKDKWGCTNCRRAWYAPFDVYLAHVVFEFIV